MNDNEYKRLCEVVADLNIAMCALDNKHNKEMKDPQKIAREKILRAYLLVDRMIIKKNNYDNQ